MKQKRIRTGRQRLKAERRETQRKALIVRPDGTVGISHADEVEHAISGGFPGDRSRCRPGAPDRFWNVGEVCPWYRCVYHLGLDVTERGSILLVEGLDDGRGACALDLADAAGEDGLTLEEVGSLVAITRERARQIETMAQERARELGAEVRTAVLDLLESDGSKTG